MTLPRPGQDPPARDAVFVGSGINALVAAAILAKSGWAVAVYEREDRVGGAVLTAPIRDGRFAHEHFSQTHTQFTSSPAYAYLRDELDARGVEYVNTEWPMAALGPGLEPVILGRDVESNVETLEQLSPGDGKMYANELARFWKAHAPYAFGFQAVDLPSAPAAFIAASLRRRQGSWAGVGAWAAELFEDARTHLTRTFASPLTRAMFAPWSEHLGLGPDDAMSAFACKALVFMQQAEGATMPVGGGSRLVDALLGVIEDHGGEVSTSANVSRIVVSGGRATGIELADGRCVGARRAVLAGVAPEQLYGRLLRRSVDEDLVARAASYAFGLGAMQIMFSLSTPPGWEHARLADVAVVNLTGGLDDVSRAFNEARRGLLPAAPTVAVGQPMAVDVSRGPKGTWILWVQMLEVPSRPRGDALGEIDAAGTWTEKIREAFADRVQALIAEHWPSLDDAVLERQVLSPADLEASNVNLVGGSIHGGASDLGHMVLGRPFPGRPSHRTPVEGLWHIGASTKPGAGLGARSGYTVARWLIAPRGPRGARARMTAGQV